MVLHVIVITCDQFQGHKMANVSLRLRATVCSLIIHKLS